MPTGVNIPDMSVRAAITAKLTTPRISVLAPVSCGSENLHAVSSSVIPYILERDISEAVSIARKGVSEDIIHTAGSPIYDGFFSDIKHTVQIAAATIITEAAHTRLRIYFIWERTNCEKLSLGYDIILKI